MADIKTELVKELLKTGTFLHREADRLLAEIELTQQQFVVLKSIEEEGTVKQKDVCSALLFEKSNVSKVIKKLVCLGFVKVSRGKEDARETYLKLTPAGRRTIRQGMIRLNEWNEKWLNSLSEEEAKKGVLFLRSLF